MRGKTIYIRKKDRDLSELDCPSAGPYPSITGMRKHYWGNATLLKQGAYVYKPTKKQLKALNIID